MIARRLLVPLMIAVIAAASFPPTAGAITWIFCLDPTDCVGGTGVLLGHEATFTSGAHTLTARAYYAPLRGAGPFVDATLGRYALGLGVTSATDDAPALDNFQFWEDFLLLELPGLFNISALVLSDVDGDDDANVWIGTGPAGLDLSDGTRSVGSLDGGGISFTQVFSGDVIPPPGTTPVILDDHTVGLSGAGRYLLVSGIVRGEDDDFTIRALSTEPVPEPATLLLLGSGLVAAVLAIRRRRRR